MRARTLARAVADKPRRSFSTDGLRMTSYKAIFLQSSFNVFERYRSFVSTLGDDCQVVEIFQQFLVLIDGKQYSPSLAFGVYDELRPPNSHDPRLPWKSHRRGNLVSTPGSTASPRRRRPRIVPPDGTPKVCARSLASAAVNPWRGPQSRPRTGVCRLRASLVPALNALGDGLKDALDPVMRK